MSKPVTHSHSYQHFEDLQLSAKDFYAALEARIASYQFPDVECRVVERHEDSILSSKRQYLQIEHHYLSYLVCAAPFGRSFFISWYLEQSEDGFTLALRKIPILRWLVPSEKTYYQIDSELMFKNSIENIVKAAVHKLMVEHGYRQPDIELAE
ncbi:hypothetical protein [Mucilaginibacter ginsenosidivorax]|uniref:Uncharacterized protein n=1 Tax=Mucilaginibacter ginsenosidivorax TaxID=862126 RepID=A0A5B8W4X1_9SPHI|nr:hypothetical protein [Mucilaginibacter ginsenosidivorax]QEC77388.1 hypothetical protein FSB76_16060 [Mucilaginibacter ginsenosidivorax]